MTTFYAVFSMLLAFGYWFLIAGVTLRVLMKRRSVQSVTAWLLIIYIVPLFGVIIYVLFGELNLGKKRAERARKMWPTTVQWLSDLKKCDSIFSTHTTPLSEPLFQLCENRHGVPAVRNNQLQLFSTTDSIMTAIVNDIKNAKENIDIVFYIWEEGGIVDDVTQALVDATNRGVRCRMMLDSAGSFRFFHNPESSIKYLQNSGVEIVEVLKVNVFRLFFRRMDLRQHRKLVLIDHKISYIGSMNMVDPFYFKQDSGVGQWVDLMTRIEGPAALAMDIIFACDWEIETGQHLLPPRPECTLKEPSQLDDTGHIVNIIPSGPGYPEEMIHQALLTAIYSSRKKLTMTTPYLVPSDDILHAICTAALRGVDVNLIVPAKNDSVMVSWASKSFFSELLAAGVKIHQFRGGLLHSKIILVDDQLTLVGTVNLDMRSLWLNFEITAVIDDLTFGQEIAQLQNDYISNSSQLHFSEWQQRSLMDRIMERLFYFFSPLL